MEIVHQFGIDPTLLIAQIVNFAIILWVLKKFLYKPVMDMLYSRKVEIKKGLEDAEKARKLLEEASEKERKLLKNAQAESKKILDDTKKQADALLDAAKAETKTETERMLKEAKEQINFETKQAEKRLSAHISSLAIAMLAKSLPDIISEEAQINVIKKATEKLKGESN